MKHSMLKTYFWFKVEKRWQWATIWETCIGFSKLIEEWMSTCFQLQPERGKTQSIRGGKRRRKPAQVKSQSLGVFSIWSWTRPDRPTSARSSVQAFPLFGLQSSPDLDRWTELACFFYFFGWTCRHGRA